mgnify:CR=1 FL=1
MAKDTDFQVPRDHQGRAECLEQLAEDVRAGSDQAEAIARLALVLAANHRDKIIM